MRKAQLKLWARYINDILLLWDGSADSLDQFFISLNRNDRGISLSYKSSQNKINFLDLEFEIRDQQFKFQTYFKPTDCNGFIPMDSCHHRSWLCTVPRSQFLQLRKNCSGTETFKTQTMVLRQRFLDKGYDQIEVDFELQNTLGVDSGSLLVVKP